MGISTFVHVVTDAEASVIQQCPDSILVQLLNELSRRPFLLDKPTDADTIIQVLSTLHLLLTTSQNKLKKDDQESKVYLEEKTKFWSAARSGMFVKVRYGRLGTTGQTNQYSGTDAAEYFKKKVQEKLRKGYRKVDPDARQKGVAVSALEQLYQTLEKTKSGKETAEPDLAAPSGEEAKEDGEAVEDKKPSAVALLPRRSGRTRKSVEATPTPKVAPKIKKNKRKVSAKLEFPMETAVKKRVDLDKCGALVSFLLSQFTTRQLDETSHFECLKSVLASQTVGKDVRYGPIYLASADATAGLYQLIQDKGGIPDAQAVATIFDQVTKFPDVLGGVTDIARETDLEYAQTHVLSFVAMLEHAVEHQCGLLIHFW